jgi:RNA polymerase sigma factor (sigma-70 family)
LSREARHAFLAAIEKDHGRQLRRYLANRMRAAAADVPDLVQEVFLRLLRVPDHDAIRNPQAYLFTVASHVLHQHALRRTATPESIDIADVISELQDVPDSDPELQAQLAQRCDAIEQGLKQRWPGAYATLVLHQGYGLPLQDISERLGVSYSMTKKYLAKALQYVEHHLQESEGAP